MGFGVICHLITHAGGECEDATVLEFGAQLAFETEEEVAFLAPVVGEIASGVFHHADACVAELARPPVCNAALTAMLSGLDLPPIRGAEWDV